MEQYRVIIGYGILQENEFNMPLEQKYIDCTLVEVDSPGYGKNVYLALLALDNFKWRAQVGDTIRVSFHHPSQAARNDHWHGELVLRHQPKAINVQAFFIHRPSSEEKDEDGRVICRYHVHSPEIIAHYRVKHLDAAFDICNDPARKSCQVNVTLDQTDMALARDFNSMQAIIDNVGGRISIWRTLLLSNDLSTLPVVDTFANFVPAAHPTGDMATFLRQECEALQLEPEQRRIVEHYLRSVLGPVQLITGPPGVGKTYVSESLMKIVTQRVRVDPQNPKTSHMTRSVFTTPVNAALEEMTRFIGNALHGKLRNSSSACMVTRVFPSKAAKTRKNRYLQEMKNRDLKYYGNSLIDYLIGVDIAYETLESSKTTSSGSTSNGAYRTPRHDSSYYSVEANMVRRAGLVGSKGFDHSKRLLDNADEAVVEWFTNACAAINAWRARESPRSLEEAVEWEIGMRNLMLYTIVHSDIVVIGLNICGDPIIAEAYQRYVVRADIVFCNEAGRAHEAEILNAIVAFNGAMFVLDGDPDQLGPLVKHGVRYGSGYKIMNEKYNCFGSQTGMSLLERLELASVHISRLSESKRFTTPLAEVVSSYYFGKPFRIPSPNPKDDHPLVQKIKDFHKTHFNLKDHLLAAITVKSDYEARTAISKSKINYVTCATSLHVIRLLIEYGIDLEDVCLLTAYGDQYRLQQAGLEWLQSQPKYKDANWSQLAHLTTDTMQGGERAYVILDCVVDSEEGHMKDFKRINGAVSSAGIGFLAVVDHERHAARNIRAKYSGLQHLLDKMVSRGVDKVMPTTWTTVPTMYEGIGELVEALGREPHW